MKNHTTISDIILNREGLYYKGDLKAYFKIIFNHARNLAHPYHNFRHMFHVFFMCHKAIQYYGDRISKLEARALLIAALFHDFDHTGRTGHDDCNIQIALRGLHKHLLPEDKVIRDTIDMLITSTEYPHRIPSSELPFLAQILRDADMCQAMSVAWIQQIIFGLSTEMGTKPHAILEMQVKFLNELHFCTEWAQREFPDHEIQDKIAESEELLACLA